MQAGLRLQLPTLSSLHMDYNALEPFRKILEPFEQTGDHNNIDENTPSSIKESK